jgi:methionyl aminopeptidase
MAHSRGIQLKTPDQIRLMRKAGLVVNEGLEAMGAAIAPGVTTAEIDAVGRDVLAAHGAKSSFLNYGAEWGYTPYPAVACISVNETIVHGIPGDRKLREGDIVSIDFGGIVQGWHADAARTFVVGQTEQKNQDLIAATERSMWAGIAAIWKAKRIGDISWAVEHDIRSNNRKYGIIREYTGHGIGSAMHEDPDVPNWGKIGRGARVQTWMCLCVEPMLTLGGEGTVELDDDWTVVTADSSWAAHWENTTAILPDGLWVTTEPDGGKAQLAARGIPFASLD